MNPKGGESDVRNNFKIFLRSWGCVLNTPFTAFKKENSKFRYSFSLKSSEGAILRCNR